MWFIIILWALLLIAICLIPFYFEANRELDRILAQFDREEIDHQFDRIVTDYEKEERA